MEKEAIVTNFDLAHFLKSRFGKEIEFDYIKMVANKNDVKGKYEGSSFLILFEANNYLQLYTKDAGMFDKLMPSLNEIMNNAGPICCYDLISGNETNRENGIIAMEWNLLNQEERIRAVINGRADDNDSRCINVSLFDGRSVEYYIEDEETKKEKNNRIKIFGVYPGCLNNPEYYASCSEDELYFVISTLSRVVFSLKNEYEYKEGNSDISAEIYALEYCINLTRRFGIELPEPEIGKHILETPSYKAWFNWWNNYFQYDLTDDQIRNYRILKAKKKDTSAFRPAGDWRDLIKEDYAKIKQ